MKKILVFLQAVPQHTLLRAFTATGIPTAAGNMRRKSKQWVSPLNLVTIGGRCYRPDFVN